MKPLANEPDRQRRQPDSLVTTPIERGIVVYDDALHHVLTRPGNHDQKPASGFFPVNPVLQDGYDCLVGFHPIGEFVEDDWTVPSIGGSTTP